MNTGVLYMYIIRGRSGVGGGGGGGGGAELF